MNSVALDICLVMGLYPRERIREIEENSIYGIQNAANVFQWNIVDGILDNGITNIMIVNSIYIGSFPKKYKKAIIPSYKFNVRDIITGNNVGFLNVPVVKELFRFATMKKSLKEWALNNKKNKVVIAYAATYPMTKALSYIKKVNPDVKTCLVVPDLPMYMNLSQSRAGILHHIKNRVVSIEMLKADCFVLLTEQMKEMIKGSERKPISIVEGMSPAIVCGTENSEVKNELPYRYFLYTGTLNYQYGILDLLDAYESARTGDIHLVICGEGEAADELRKREDSNRKIHFFGCCSHEKVLSLQKSAFALVNPRCNEGEYTKYSFPSKIMEYMCSGRPTLAYPLEGIPDEYKKYLICIDNESGGIRRALEDIAQKDEEFCREFGKKARRFIADNKNCKMQMQKVIEMFNGVE